VERFSPISATSTRLGSRPASLSIFNFIYFLFLILKELVKKTGKKTGKYFEKSEKGQKNVHFGFAQKLS
jgi:hypothetical protein